MTTPEVHITRLVAQRDALQKQVTGMRAAFDDVTNQVNNIDAHIDDRDYGLASSAVARLRADLPNDYGGPVTHFPLLDRYAGGPR